jgi:(E)-4-hydroxy-3-methylbut-2-enyl-diphosphate synthase
MKIVRRNTRPVKVRDLIIGSSHPILVQSMAATKTQDIPATLEQVRILSQHGADIIRIAVDSKADVAALAEIRKMTAARLVVDLQESYKLIKLVAPHVDKVRYNPGHLHHHEKSVAAREKVKFIVDNARQYDLALRIGVNFGSIDPALKEAKADPLEAALASAREHIKYLEDLNFTNFVVSLKSSNPNDVIEINQRFAEEHKDIPIHLGVTEAGMLPMGEVKTRIAFEQLLARGIGDTLRVSLTLPFSEKYQEILVGKKIIQDVQEGRFRSVPRFEQNGLNLISCPSCSRVENEKFVELAREVKEMAEFAKHRNITIAVMGCRVNGPGETDDADIGLWCAPNHVNLKRKSELVGSFSYHDIIPKVREILTQIISVEAI